MSLPYASSSPIVSQALATKGVDFYIWGAQHCTSNKAQSIYGTIHGALKDVMHRRPAPKSAFVGRMIATPPMLISHLSTIPSGQIKMLQPEMTEEWVDII